MAEQHTDAPPTVAFAGGTLDRAAHLRDDAERLRRLDSSRAVLVGRDQEVALNDGGRLALSPVADLPSDAALTLLGLDASGAAVFAHDAPAGQFSSLRTVMDELDPAEAALAA